MDPKRNDPCPCGSGRKFKRCCKSADALPAHRALAPEQQSPRSACSDVWLLKITLKHLDPEPVRTLAVSPSMTLFELHEWIQSFGWSGEHLWAFRDPSQRGALAGPPPRGRTRPPIPGVAPTPDASKVPLAACMGESGDVIHYEYDFGDGWIHEIRLETGVHLPEPFEPTLLSGLHAFPPEDCGGPPGYARMQTYWKTGKDPHGDAEFEDWASCFSPTQFVPKSRTEALASFSEANRQILGDFLLPGIQIQGDRAQAMSRSLLADLQTRLLKTILEFDQAHGVTTTPPSITFTPDNATITLETAIIRDDGIVMNRAATTYVERADEYGLNPDWLGHPFKCGKDYLRIIGLKPRSKASVLLETVTDAGMGKQQVKMHPERVLSHFSH